MATISKAYWLLDERYDFLIGSFLSTYKINQADFVIVSSHPARCHYEYSYLVLSNDTYESDVEEYQHIEQIEPEDLNRRFIMSGEISLNKLNQLDKGKKIFIASYTGAGLPIHKKIIALTGTGLFIDQQTFWYGCNIGARNDEGAALINDKKWQMEFFSRIGEASDQNTVFCANENKVRAIYRRRMRMSATNSIVIKPRGLSGGYKMGRINLHDSKDVLEDYFCMARGRCKDGYMISDYVEHDYSYSGAGVINSQGDVRFINITNEQYLADEFRYGGLIYPAYYYNEKMEARIEEKIKKIGVELANEGYTGFFNVDFIAKDDMLCVIEINARIAFCTILAALMVGYQNFWRLLRGYKIANQMTKDGKDYNLKGPQNHRILLGKLKLEERHLYRGLTSKANINEWWHLVSRTDDRENEENVNFETILYGAVGDDFRIELDDRKLTKRKHSSASFDYGSCLGIFGRAYSLKITREKIRMQAGHYHYKYFQNKTKRILFMYVEDSFGFRNQSFNFSIDYDLSVIKTQEKYILSLNDKVGDMERFFWEDNISGVSLLVGDNGTGKSLSMQLMCQWIDLLAASKIPNDVGGVLVFQDGEVIRYIGFENGEEKSVESVICNEQCFDEQRGAGGEGGIFNVINLKFVEDSIESLSSFLKNGIRLVYYSNGRGEDFNFSESGVIENRTYINRLRESNVRYQANKDVYRNYRYNSFAEQINWACDLSVDFPLIQLAVSLDEDMLQDLLPEKLKSVANEIDYSLHHTFGMHFMKRIDVQFLRHVLFGYISYLTKNYMKIISDDDVVHLDENIKYNLKNTLSMADDINRALCEILKNFFLDTARQGIINTECDKEISVALRAFCDNYSGNEFNNWFRDYWEPSYLWSKKNTTWIYNIDSAPKKISFLKFWRTFEYFNDKLDSISFSWRGGNGELAHADLFTAWMPKSYDNRTTWIISDISEGVFDPKYQRRLIKRFVDWANDYYIGRKVQAWVMGYTPFIISDFPEKAVLYFQENKGFKIISRKGNRTFAQNFYQLIRDSFNLREGIIGEYATSTIDKVVNDLHEISVEIANSDKLQEQISLYDSLIEYLENVISIIAEPLIEEQLKVYLNWCKRELEKTKKNQNNA